MRAEKKGMMTVKDVATETNISLSKAYELVYSGELPSIKVGRSIRVKREEYDRWISGLRSGRL